MEICSYYVHYFSGWQGNGYSCQDVDECSTNNGGCSTTPMVQCLNTMGSFHCGPCPPGMRGKWVMNVTETVLWTLDDRQRWYGYLDFHPSRRSRPYTNKVTGHLCHIIDLIRESDTQQSSNTESSQWLKPTRSWRICPQSVKSQRFNLFIDQKIKITVVPS